MRPTEAHRPTRSVRLVAYLLVLLLAYGLLGTGDFVLGRWLDHQTTQLNAPARAIEERRVAQQDRPQIARAWADGYRAMLYPALFETGAYRQLALRHGLAPLAPAPNSRLIYCNEGTGLVTYRSDRFGLRNDDSVWNSEHIDTVLIGDSYVQGACVDGRQTIAGHMTAATRNVVNLGTAGNNPIHYAALARAFLPALAPRYAVIVFYANDNADEEDSVFRPTYIDAQVDYVRRVGDQRLPGAAFARLAPLYAQAQALADATLAHADHPPAASGQADRRSLLTRATPYFKLRHTRALLLQTWKRATRPALPWSTKLAVDTLIQQCHALGCKPLFAYIPNSAFWRPDPRADDYRLALARYVAEQMPGEQLIDTSAAITRHGLALYGSAGGHLSGDGYSLVAQALRMAMRP